MRRFAISIGLILTLSACVSGGNEPTSTSPPPATSTTEPTTTPPTSTTTSSPVTSTSQPEEGIGVVYFFFDGYPVEPGPYLVPVARPASNDLESAVRLLLEGPTPEEHEGGLSSTIPTGTTLLGVEVSDDGVARIDISGEFATGGGSLSVLGRVAQIVYTATRFDGVVSVEFLMEGTPVDVLSGEGLILEGPQRRADYADLLPAIGLETPTWGARVGSSLRISGTVAPESTGTVNYVVVDAVGLIVAKGSVPSTPGENRGEFAIDVDLSSPPEPGAGSVIVFELTEDGTQTHVLEYPLVIGP